MRNVDGRTPGLNAIELTLSSGGDATSMSFIGFVCCVVVAVVVPNIVFAPNVVAPPNKLIVRRQPVRLRNETDDFSHRE